MLLLLSGCKENILPENTAKEAGKFKPDSTLPFRAAPAIAQTDTGLPALFDSIGPILLGDFNGDRMDDTVRAVHVRSVEALLAAPLRKEFSDHRNPYEPVCGGWGVHALLSKAIGRSWAWDPVYFCGQQPRVQTYDWVSSDRLDTLGMPELKAMAGEGVSHAIGLFSQAGISTFLIFTGDKFALFEPPEEP
jgi:hypothetical protein